MSHHIFRISTKTYKNICAIPRYELNYELQLSAIYQIGSLQDITNIFNATWYTPIVPNSIYADRTDLQKFTFCP